MSRVLFVACGLLFFLIVHAEGIVPYGYTGRERDASGLTNYRNRYLDPSLGRFTQRDPIGPGGGINDYGYALGNPVLLVDPQGLEPRQGQERTYYQQTERLRSLLGGIPEPPPNLSPTELAELAEATARGMIPELPDVPAGASARQVLDAADVVLCREEAYFTQLANSLQSHAAMRNLDNSLHYNETYRSAVFDQLYRLQTVTTFEYITMLKRRFPELGPQLAPLLSRSYTSSPGPGVHLDPSKERPCPMC